MPSKPLYVNQVLSLNRSALPLSPVPSESPSPSSSALFPPVLTATLLSRVGMKWSIILQSGDIKLKLNEKTISNCQITVEQKQQNEQVKGRVTRGTGMFEEVE